MKKIIGFLVMALAVSLCAFALADVKINRENFPDGIFREHVASWFDLDENGSLSAEETADVQEIDVSGMEIGNLKGIEHFTELRELDCSGNDLVAVGLIRLTKLEKLNCSNNRITRLNLSNCKHLEYLDCSNNRLTRLDTGSNQNLQYLYCSGNDIGQVDITKNTSLIDTSIDEYTKVKSTQPPEEDAAGDFDFVDTAGKNQKTCGIFRYVPVSEKECYVTGILDRDKQGVQYDKDDHVLFFPEKLDQYTVAGIAEGFVTNSGGYFDEVARVFILPDTIRYIGENAFSYSCISMIRLNDKLKVIGDFAFTMHHPGVMVLPESIEQIGKNPFQDDFDGGNYFPLYICDPQGKPWKSANGKLEITQGALYDVAEKRLIAYLDQMEYIDGHYQSVREYHVPDGTQIIGENAFIGTKDLLRVVLPEGLKRIEENAFCYCGAALREIIIPSSVTEFGKDSIDPDTTIVCRKDSAAEDYAAENGNEIRYIQDNEPLQDIQPSEHAQQYYIDREESLEFVMKLDSDQDGTISGEEILAQIRRNANAAKPALFTEEGADYLNMTFREYLLWAYDQDRDGALNQQEYDHYLSVYGIWDPDIDIPHP